VIGGLTGAWNQVPSAVADPWYLSGGIPAANCLAAYQPKGAASLAASYDNIAAPGNGLADGTYDAALGVAPTWSAVNGWIGGGSAYLLSGITPAIDQSWSFAISISGAAAGAYFFGSYRSGTPGMSVAVRRSASTSIQYHNGSATPTSVAPYADNGVFIIAGNKAYRNGVDEDVTIAVGNAPALPIDLIGFNIGGTHYAYVVNVRSLAIYNTALSPSIVTALNTAMAAL
jgi:hypothetical protein